MRMRVLILLTSLLAACGSSPTLPSALTSNETYITAQTAYYSELGANRDIVAHFTNNAYMVTAGDGTRAPAAGWALLLSDEIVYWRPFINDPERSNEDLRWLAMHEVCHFITGGAHDARHVLCQSDLNGRS